MMFSNVVGDMKKWSSSKNRPLLLFPAPGVAVGVLMQSLCGIIWKEFISRLTTVIELDLQLRFAVNISLLAQWWSYFFLDMLKDILS